MRESSHWGFPGSASGKEPTCQCRDKRDPGLIPGSGRSLGEGNGNPPQYSCLGNPMDRETWWTIWGHKQSDTTEHTHKIIIGPERLTV